MFFFALLLGACSFVQDGGEPSLAVGHRQLSAPLLTSAGECRQHLDASGAHPELGDYNALPMQLDILVWNTQKSKAEHWEPGLQQWRGNAELALLQEAPFSLLHADAKFPVMVLATGYHGRGGPTGVVSASHVMPLASCSFQDLEPWLRTPKASGISRYALTGRDDSLLVANIHAVNFSFGLGPLENQLSRLAEVVREHRGPILFAGDFNTWRPARLALVDELMQSLGLQPTPWSDDRRSTVFGHPLDHVYSRGLRLVDAKSQTVRSSDHNPLFITMQVEPAATAIPAADRPASDPNRAAF